ncbi:indolepyruvate ferredoxin oxidoreductase subunit alpha [Ferrovibrio sp.]|uniref:indolepyruvate ferredoxin oxidoreductase subunit alpha n=1 Tax=Ferrovibrio sp. TaxID=1917215 RepID=UPI002617D994|nr:indolepyruvate ferredoxin oxidoreductase subunit alpha [Ferrovibrio sp.]
MERSFAKEIESLRLGDGDTFRGEGILAVTKALLQSGVSYVGGYQGAPVSHLIDVLVQSQDILDDLGIHLETCTNEASAAAMLGASINYPARGCVTWKAIVGTNVASDALSNLSSAGVVGGALIVVGEDYGEGASVIQERSHAYAMKSSIWLLDPRPDLPTITRSVEQAFELSEISNTPVMLELRIRACHVTGEFPAKENRPAKVSRNSRLPGPSAFNYDHLAHPPATFMQEKLKLEQRLPAARKYIVEQGLNEIMPGELNDIGIIVQGGLYNALNRALMNLGLSDAFGRSRVPMLVLNVTYPLVPEQITAFCAGKRAVLMIEEGSPDYIEQAIHATLRKADINTRLHGKGMLPEAGEYTIEALTRGLLAFIKTEQPQIDVSTAEAAYGSALDNRKTAQALIGPTLPQRPPTFCTGCPERPVFTAIKLAEREIGKVHIAADIGCHALATFAPFSLGHSILGYGMSLASAAGVGPLMRRRSLAIMGDGGFWHNGVLSGVASALFNRGDGVLVIMQNGYTSATGVQYIPSSAGNRVDGLASGSDIESTLKALGVKWVRRLRSYGLKDMTTSLKEALTTASQGLKVIIAEGECQLARQRRLRSEESQALESGERVLRTRFGIDDAVCTGDHSCIRLSGCPSLTIKPNPDPLRTDPVASVNSSCVGCGHCGEVAHAAVLCPSFYKTEIVHNPTLWDRLHDRFHRMVIGWLGGGKNAAAQPAAGE